MNEEDKGKLLGHEYDGIKELDHQLPRWWIGTFVLTVLFAIPYFIYYFFGFGPSLKEEHQVKMAVINQMRAAEALAATEFDPGFFDKINSEQGEVKGKIVFEENCVACHKEKGIGDIGPNLTDNYWIHGKGAPADLYKVVYHGVEDKGMPIWNESLSKEEIYQAVSYVRTLHNLKLPGKEPQGEKVQE